MTGDSGDAPGGVGLLQSLGSFSGSAMLPRWTVAHALAAAEATLGRFRALGVRLAPDNRLERAARLLTRQAGGPRGLEAHRTVLEQYVIASAIRRADPQLRERLSRLLSGADTPAQDSQTTPRDVQFELFVAAALVHGGVVGVHLGEPDIRIPAGERHFGLAVKRLTSERKMTTRVRDAVRQFRRASLAGVVVVNLDRYAGSRPAATADADCAAKVLELRDLLRVLAAEDVVGGVVGFATTADGYAPNAASTVGTIRVHCYAQLIAVPGDNAAGVSERLRLIARNVIRGVTHALQELEPRALHLIADAARRG